MKKMNGVGMVAKVHQFYDYAHGDLIHHLETLLELARHGELVGLLYVADLKTDPKTRRGRRAQPTHLAYGLTGSLRDDPIRSLGASARIWRRLQDMANEAEASG
jgi:hypothetical protein